MHAPPVAWTWPTSTMFIEMCHSGGDRHDRCARSEDVREPGPTIRRHTCFGRRRG